MFCRATEFNAPEGAVLLPAWIGQALGGYGDDGELPRVRAEPWLLPAPATVTLKALSPGFEPFVKTAAAMAVTHPPRSLTLCRRCRHFAHSSSTIDGYRGKGG